MGKDASKSFIRSKSPGNKQKNISKKEATQVKKQKDARRNEKRERNAREVDILKQRNREEREGIKKDKKQEEEAKEDEHGGEAFDKDGYVQLANEQEISSKDEELMLRLTTNRGKKPAEVTPEEELKENENQGSDEDVDGEGRSRKQINLADMIMGQLESQTQMGREMAVGQSMDANSLMNPKFVNAYKKLGDLLHTYRSGKVPKLFTIIPHMSNWEDVMFLTKPDLWSPAAVFEGTKMFSSSLNTKFAQRYYSLVLFDAVRRNISTYKKLNYHLYMALKRAIFKPQAFFKAIILPLAEDATSREAIIVGSILQKVSLPVLDASAALMKMCEMDYKIGTGFFIKVLLSKKFALPTRAMLAVHEFFISFIEEENDLPVMWHQSLLIFVEFYKKSLTDDQVKSIKKLCKRKTHPSITTEIRKELAQLKLEDMDME